MKKSIIIYIFIVTVLVVYLVNANEVVAYFTKTEVLNKSSFQQFQSNADGHAYVEMLRSEDDLLENHTMIGIGLAYSIQPNVSKCITLVFKNIDSDTCYYVTEQEPVVRQAEYEYFSQNGSLSSAEIGFNINFSTITMQDGMYDLYVHIQNSDSCEALVKTTKQYVKKGSSFLPAT